MQMIDIDVPQLQEWVEAMKVVGLGEIDMNSADEPTCETPGCHAGLLFKARKHMMRPMRRECYDYNREANYFAEDIGFHNRVALEDFAEDNPEWWGCLHGGVMFTHHEAFGMSYSFPEDIVVEWWTEVLARTVEAQS